MSLPLPPPIPPPPAHPPPTPEELASTERGRGRRPVTLSGPIAQEIAAERGEAAEDKSPAPRTAKSEPPARSCSRKSTQLCQGRMELSKTRTLRFFRRARGGTLNPPSLTGRPLALRPNNPSYSQVVVNSEGTWVRVSQPPGVTSRERALFQRTSTGRPQ